MMKKINTSLSKERIKYTVKRNPISTSIGILAGIVFLFYVVSSVFQSRQKSPHEGGFAMAVEAQKVTVKSIEDKVVTVGSVKANESVMLRSELPGRVKEILFKEGADVNEGAVLIVLHNEVHKAQLDQAEANLRLTEASYQRVDKLFKGKFKSPLEVDKALAEYKRDQALVAGHKAIVEKTRITAPFGGIMGLRLVSPGDYINAGDDIVNIEDIDPVKIDFKLPELYVSKVKSGQTIQVKADALVGKEFKGKIYAINPLLNEGGRNLELRAVVQNAERHLLPGMFVIVTATLDQYPNAILVPEEALVPKGKDQFVFRVVNDQAKLTKVNIGLRTHGKAHIRDGLSPQDVVVTAGQLKIQQDTPVKVINLKG